MADHKEPRRIARMLGLSISVAQAKRTFPGIPPGLFYAAAPHDGRGRFLTLGEAFAIAKASAEAEAAEAAAQRVAQDRETAAAEKHATAALPAVDHLAGVIAAEMAAIYASLRRRGASDYAISLIETASGRSARHAARLRVRVARQIEKAGLADDRTP